MSVVDGDWDNLKKYNLFEIYNQAVKDSAAASAAPEKADE